MRAIEHERFYELVSRGFDAGHFASAYETGNYAEAIEALKLPRVVRELHAAHRAAFTLGFFRHVRLADMGRYREAYVEAYRSEGGRACLEAGFCARRREIDENVRAEDA